VYRRPLTAYRKEDTVGVLEIVRDLAFGIIANDHRVACGYPRIAANDRPRVKRGRLERDPLDIDP